MNKKPNDQHLVFYFGVSRGQLRYIHAFKIVYYMDQEIVWIFEEIQLPEKPFYERIEMVSHVVFDQHKPVPTSFLLV